MAERRDRDLLFELADGVKTIALNRPEARNALTTQTFDALSHAFLEARDDKTVRVVVLTGTGKVFSAGGDIAAMQEKIDHPELWDETGVALKRLIFIILNFDKPLIARINGHAVGFGATLALFCDVTFAVETARIGDVHVVAGLVAGDGGAVIWPQLLGLARAKEYLLTGDLMTAAEAARIGLINHAVPEEQLDEHVYGLARKLSSGASEAIRATKRLLNLPLRELAQAQMDLGMALSAQSNLSDEHQEAVRAFAEKRKPDFRS
jgi:enoyl-CoA hydratase